MNAVTKLRKAMRLILVGPPGSGKGTQSGRLLSHFQMSAISSGDLLRENIREKTPLGLEAEKIIRDGGLVADDIMVGLIIGELSKRGWVESRSNLSSGVTVSGAMEMLGGTPKTTRLQACEAPSSSFLLDGFPRTKCQAKRLDEQVHMNFVSTPKRIVVSQVLMDVGCQSRRTFGCNPRTHRRKNGACTVGKGL